MDVRQPWDPGETPDEQAARREAYERLAAAARRVGLSLDRLGDMLRQVSTNETETRGFLTQVYGVPDELLDDLLRVRMQDLPRQDEP
jgi:8-oxo-dGTP pyrophosphatase MutT (NUDIX family)